LEEETAHQRLPYGVVQPSNQLPFLELELLHPDIIGHIDEQRTITKLRRKGNLRHTGSNNLGPQHRKLFGLQARLQTEIAQ
jgi:hypothetical protein